MPNHGVNHLYINDGSGGFSKVTTGEIATDSALSYGAAMGDVNGDGHLVRDCGLVHARALITHVA